MLTSVEAIIEKNGEVRLQKPIQLRRCCRAILTIFDEKLEITDETALLSEAALAEDWNRPEEEAWSHLQKVLYVGDRTKRIATVKNERKENITFTTIDSRLDKAGKYRPIGQKNQLV